ncbi:Txe/YoeB family addiction module toxin [Zobellia uliginosa]|uniref:Txe/YoeB family addiction module toxin n=1 Tax=Zobellia uliginosa TaxID=143224 RepID=UPI001C07980B|nr:Txe/YoeB family addiction module toxin [Zobellia uliginosa]MBU2946607.1 Txe/YoeB family addiction module toxin [Zobellia uliginosa]
MEIVLTREAEKDLKYWKETSNRAIQKRITKLLESVVATPFSGIGKPEALKHNLSGCYSRRINIEHRLVYKVEKDKIVVISLRFHY